MGGCASQEGQTLRYASAELRGNREIAMKTLSKDMWALQFASEELRGDREIVMKAVSKNGYMGILLDVPAKS